jgi:hypothetical protein
MGRKIEKGRRNVLITERKELKRRGGGLGENVNY